MSQSKVFLKKTSKYSTCLFSVRLRNGFFFSERKVVILKRALSRWERASLEKRPEKKQAHTCAPLSFGLPPAPPHLMQITPRCHGYPHRPSWIVSRIWIYYSNKKTKLKKRSCIKYPRIFERYEAKGQRVHITTELHTSHTQHFFGQLVHSLDA